MFDSFSVLKFKGDTQSACSFLSEQTFLALLKARRFAEALHPSGNHSSILSSKSKLFTKRPPHFLYWISYKIIEHTEWPGRGYAS